ncbi:MAG: redoxin domain-containing protein [Bacteroidetes bacterium]|jgi:thiol-disulfide isomerase/thioredoxin|nr:redoxin domain-containing protein [Bacteroidota bacterium]
MKRQPILWLLSLTLLLVGCKGLQPSTPSDGPPLDDRLKRIRMTRLDGQPVSWPSLRGKPVLLNFWATWCAPCVAEMESIQYLQDRLGGQVHIIALSNEPAEKISAFGNTRDLDFPLWQLQGEYIDAFVLELPTTLLIDAEGQIVEDIEGGQSWSSPEMVEKVERLIK